MEAKFDSQNQNIMKAKRLFLVIVVLLAAGGGLWLARSDRPTNASNKSSLGDGLETPHNLTKPGQILRPPDQSRRFRDFTPEQRVEFARKGHGPGG